MMRVVEAGRRAALCLAFLCLPAGAWAQSVFSYVSVEGDTVGQGQRGVFTPRNADFSISGSAAEPTLTVVADNGEAWTIAVAAPRGEVLLPGRYYAAERVDVRTGRAVGLDVRSNAGACDLVWGSVFIRQIEADGEGDVSAIEGSFIQHCAGPAAPALAGTFSYKSTPWSFKLDSSPGDYIGLGMQARYFGDTSTFTLQGTTQAIHYKVSGQRADWRLTLRAPAGRQLREGWFWTERFPDETHAGLDFSGEGRGCNSSKGKLTIIRMTTLPDGTIANLWAEFTQHCESKDSPPLTGTIHFRR